MFSRAARAIIAPPVFMSKLGSRLQIGYRYGLA
jgi:hypothetical protein